MVRTVRPPASSGIGCWTVQTEKTNVTKAETTAPTTQPTDTKGVLIALAAYVLWGV